MVADSCLLSNDYGLSNGKIENHLKQTQRFVVSFAIGLGPGVSVPRQGQRMSPDGGIVARSVRKQPDPDHLAHNIQQKQINTQERLDCNICNQ